MTSPLSSQSIFPWVQPAWDLVATEVRTNRLAHALLIEGDTGIGIEAFARAIVSSQLCSQIAGVGSACGQCKACDLHRAETHPDLRVLEPTGAAQIIKVDQVREAVVFLATTPQIGDCKLVLISDAHRMNINAANALLKVLEEPSGNSLLLLVTNRPQLLLPTVRSRCRKLVVLNPTEAQARDYCLAEGITQDEFDALAAIIGYRPLQICEWVKEGQLAQWKELFSGLESFCAGSLSCASLTDSLKDLGLSNILEWLMRMAASNSKRQTGIDRETWVTMYERLLNLQQEVDRGTNPNRQLLLDECFLRWKAASS